MTYHPDHCAHCALEISQLSRKVETLESQMHGVIESNKQLIGAIRSLASGLRGPTSVVPPPPPKHIRHEQLSPREET